MFTAILTLVSAFALSGIAAYYSVVGLIAIFASAPIPIAIMGGSLEVAKLVVASWLYKNWNNAPKLLKYYFTTAVAILMIITSLGIFGYLSKAHLDQAASTGDASAKLEIIDEKIKIAKENIAVERKNLKQLDEGVDQVMARTGSEAGADKATRLRRSQQGERQRSMVNIEAEQKRVSVLVEERIPLATEVRKVEAEVGPLKYVAELLYGKEDADSHFDSAVRFIIILLVIVFDPLAVLLVIAGNYSLRQERMNKEPPVMFSEAPLRKQYKKRKVEVTGMEPVAMDKNEVMDATRMYHRDQDSM
jgi:hypothetical protein